jgi:hypothetical protein
MAVVNSEVEAEALRYLYFNYGPTDEERGSGVYEIPEIEIEPLEAPTSELANAQVHIGFHDRFIEGEYLTIQGKYSLYIRTFRITRCPNF